MKSRRAAECVLTVLLFFLPFLANAVPLPDFATDQEADRWFRQHSAFYRTMAEAVDVDGGYTIAPTTEWPGGVAYYEHGSGHIELNNKLQGPHRFSILIFEVTNLYQEKWHREVTDRVRRGELNNPAEFALLREIIEYDGIHLHYKVLAELKPVLETIPAEMMTWLPGGTDNFDEYKVLSAYDYLKSQRLNGHTDHYLKLFKKHRAEFLDSQPKQQTK